MKMREIEMELKHLKDLDAQRQEFWGKLEESHEELRSESVRARRRACRLGQQICL